MKPISGFLPRASSPFAAVSYTHLFNQKVYFLKLPSGSAISIACPLVYVCSFRFSFFFFHIIFIFKKRSPRFTSVINLELLLFFIYFSVESVSSNRISSSETSSSASSSIVSISSSSGSSSAGSSSATGVSSGIPVSSWISL